jgi:NTP pyrophosphatase (non-canonical NTP hydrolase)
MRESVKWFAEKMEQKLQKHDKKKGPDGWLNEDISWLIDRLKEEVNELEEKIFDFDYSEKETLKLINECADVANFAMMIADCVK